MEELAEYKERCRSRFARIHAYNISQQFVAQQLKSPSTAEFPSVREVTIVTTGRCGFTISGYVDAQNSFGATLGTHYVGTVSRPERNADSWRLDAFRISR